MRIERFGDMSLYLADCREVLPSLRADAIVTDPPYGVGVEYDGFDDTAENVAALAAEWLPLAREAATRVCFTSGVVQQWLYPRPDWVLAWFQGAGGARGNWGFSMWQPVLCYGPDPFLAASEGARPDTIYTALTRTGTFGIRHPCPKPEEVWMRLVPRVSIEGVIADPFMGSGTTGVACARLGRGFIGIEKSPAYFDEACRRVEAALEATARQSDLFLRAHSHVIAHSHE